MANIAAVRRYFQAWIDRDADAILATLGDGGTYEDPTTGGPISGDALRAHATGLWSVFPDLTFVAENVGETGPDRVAAQWVMRGTNTGSLQGLPPTGLAVEVRGADFFELRDGGIQTVTGYFDTRVTPGQLGLDVIDLPKQIGPIGLGIAGALRNDTTKRPGAIAITSMEARDDKAVAQIREGSVGVLLESLQMDGFIAAVSAAVGHRMLTVSAWESPEASRQLMTEGSAHAALMKAFLEGSLANHGHTSVWTKLRESPVSVRCDSCGMMNSDPGPGANCSCGATLPEAVPFW